MIEIAITSRTYPMSARARMIIDSTSIMMPGVSKAQIMNAAVFLLAREIRNIREPDMSKVNVKMAFDAILAELNKIGYSDLLATVIPDSKSQTKLDRFFDSPLSEDMEEAWRLLNELSDENLNETPSEGEDENESD